MTKLRAPDGKSVQLLSRALRDKALAACLETGSACSGGPIQAHSIQSAVVIESLAENGHVYMIGHELAGITFKKKGRATATTFMGFCSKHDNQIFADIDYDGLADIDATSKTQAGLHFMRAVAIELWKKRNAVTSLTAMADKTSDFHVACKALGIDGESMQCDRGFVDASLEGLNKGANELEEHYVELRRFQEKGDFEDLIVATRLLPAPPTLAVVSGLSPTQSLTGSILYDHERTVVLKYPMPHIGLIVLPHHTGTLIHMVSLRRNRFQLQELFDQLRELPEAALGIGVSKMIINHCENAVFRPSAIEQIDARTQEELLRAFWESIPEELPVAQVPNVNFFRVGRP